MINLHELVIELSQNCNLNCIMCGFGKRNNSLEKFMSFEDFKNIYNELGEFSDKVRLNGRGESTIHPDFKKIIKHINNKNEISLFTNGNYIDPEVNELFIKFDVELYFSMDSPIKGKLENIRRGVKYNTLVNNIKALSEKKSRPFIVFTLQECNIEDIIPMANFAAENNCYLIYNVVRRDEGIEGFIEIVKNKKEFIINSFKEVERIFNQSEVQAFVPNQVSGVQIKSGQNQTTCGSLGKCPNINSELCILYNGDVTPCNMFNPYVYGNIKDEPIKNILNGKKKKWFEENHKSYYYCKNCACIVR